MLIGLSISKLIYSTTVSYVNNQESVAMNQKAEEPTDISCLTVSLNFKKKKKKKKNTTKLRQKKEAKRSKYKTRLNGTSRLRGLRRIWMVLTEDGQEPGSSCLDGYIFSHSQLFFSSFLSLYTSLPPLRRVCYTLSYKIVKPFACLCPCYADTTIYSCSSV